MMNKLIKFFQVLKERLGGKVKQFFTGVKSDLDEGLEMKEIAFKFIERGPYSVQIFSSEGLTLGVNEAYEKLWNLKAEDVVGSYNILKDKQVEEQGIMSLVERAFKGESIILPVIKYIEPTGRPELIGKSASEYSLEMRVHYVGASIFPVFNKGKISIVMMMHIDVTKEYAADQERKELVYNFVDKSPRSVQIFNPDGLCISVNEAWGKLWNSRAEEVVGIYNILEDKQIEEQGLLDLYKRAFKGESVIFPAIEYIAPRQRPELLGKSASEYPSGMIPQYVGGRLFSIKDVTGKITKVVLVHQDETRAHMVDKAKSEFISLASHQLRTPLSGIKWVIESLMESSKLTENQRYKLKDLYLSNERLIVIVNDLLNVSRIESEKVFAEKESVNIGEVINSVISTLMMSAGQKGQKIDLKIKVDIETIKIQPFIVTESFKNILSNAVDYGSVNSIITVEINKEGNFYVISVNNKGPVLTGEERQRMYEKFYRGQRAKEMKTVGSGLGLFITKSYIETIGGKIWFTSDSDTGTTFYFTIPIIGV